MGYLVTKDDENGELDELVEMIDKLIEDGSGHLTVDISDSDGGVRVSTFSTTDCGGKPGACCQPTELDPDSENKQKEM